MLLRLCDDIGFVLAEDFYCHNPSKLPSPIEWVNKRKLRATISTLVLNPSTALSNCMSCAHRSGTPVLKGGLDYMVLDLLMFMAMKLSKE